MPRSPQTLEEGRRPTDYPTGWITVLLLTARQRECTGYCARVNGKGGLPLYAPNAERG